MSSAQPIEPDTNPPSLSSSEEFSALSGPVIPRAASHPATAPQPSGSASIKPADLRRSILKTIPEDVIVGSIEPIPLKVGTGSVTVIQIAVHYQDDAESAFSDWRQQFEQQTGLRLAIQRNSGLRYVDRSLEHIAPSDRILTENNLPELRAIIDRAYDRDLGRGALSAETARSLVDLRSLPFVTIDGPSTRNMEDALAAVSHADGTTSLYIAIIDVTGYIPSSSPHRPYLSGRGGALYTVHESYPLLGTKYSFGEGSFLQGQERPAWVFEITFDQQMQVIGRECKHALLVNHLRLTPDSVNQPTIYNGTVIAPIARCARALKQSRTKGP